MKTSTLIPCLLFLLFSSGCATLNAPPEPHDPWERFNRSMSHFNNKLDHAVLKPVATGYKKITPDPLEKGLHNFFSNLGEIKIILNDLLQLKLSQTAADTGRFIVNSTFGLAGFFDVAKHIGMHKHDEDFGQTMGYWGLNSGPYLVLPLFGPSSLRDGPGLLIDRYANPIREVKDDTARYSLYFLDAIDTRAQLLEAGNILEKASLDSYIFAREAYLQRRLKQIHDGEATTEETTPEEEIDIFSED